METAVQANQREFFRLSLTYALRSEMRIVRIRDKLMNTASSKVLIDDIGPGGLRFLSNLKLPAHPDVCWEFETEILGQKLQLQGCIVRAKELEDDIFEYGLNFIVDEKTRLHLMKLLNDLAKKLRQSPIVKDCPFILTEKLNFFKHLKEQGLA